MVVLCIGAANRHFWKTPGYQRKNLKVDSSSFDSLLDWLDADRERAGERYEHIRLALIEMFTHRGCAGAENLADLTIDRVSRNLPEIRDSYTGDPARYFLGMAKRVLLEYERGARRALPLPVDLDQGQAEAEGVELMHECLDKCLQKLTPANRKFILQYYREQKRTKLDPRKKLAERRGIAPGVLRVRVHRIRTVLEQCITRCLQEKDSLSSEAAVPRRD